MSRQPFHVAIHGRPEGVAGGPPAAVDGRNVETLSAQAPLGQTPLPVTFEQAEQALRQLPRLFFEPDGSFGWFAAPGTPRWDLGGMLYDRGDCVMYAELNGACPAPEFRQLLQALGGSQGGLLVQLLQPALFLDPDEFCRWWEQSQ